MMLEDQQGYSTGTRHAVRGSDVSGRVEDVPAGVLAERQFSLGLRL
jgi:hypothetical protein